jgi:hypothetical protein
MILPMNFSLNAILIILLGLVFLLGGVYFFVFSGMRFLGFGMFSTALGCICCGLTDGFTDPTPRGSLLKRVGGIAFIIGVPILIYSGYKLA